MEGGGGGGGGGGAHKAMLCASLLALRSPKILLPLLKRGGIGSQFVVRTMGQWLEAMRETLRRPH